MEPFGYFRATVDGWEDCAETDEGARPLYEAPRWMPIESAPVHINIVVSGQGEVEKAMCRINGDGEKVCWPTTKRRDGYDSMFGFVPMYWQHLPQGE